MRQSRITTRALGCALLLLPFAVAQAGGSNKVHLDLARDFVNDLRQQAVNGIVFNSDDKLVNSYATSTGDSYIRLKQDGYLYAENYSKCSSFINRLLERAYNWNWKALGATTNSPNAQQLAELIRNRTGLNRITSFLNLKPGDIMAVDYLGSSSTSSGHAMLVNKVLWDEPTSYQGQTVYWVSVIDCSKSPHDSDTRLLRGEELNGVGRGIMGVRVDATGNILGHFWSKIMKPATYRAQTAREIVIGRVPVVGP